MAQSTTITSSSGTTYTFNSTTNATTMTISDDKFAELLAINKLIEKLEALRASMKNG